MQEGGADTPPAGRRSRSRSGRSAALPPREGSRHASSVGSPAPHYVGSPLAIPTHTCGAERSTPKRKRGSGGAEAAGIPVAKPPSEALPVRRAISHPTALPLPSSRPERGRARRPPRHLVRPAAARLPHGMLGPLGAGSAGATTGWRSVVHRARSGPAKRFAEAEVPGCAARRLVLRGFTAAGAAMREGVKEEFVVFLRHDSDCPSFKA